MPDRLPPMAANSGDAGSRSPLARLRAVLPLLAVAAIAGPLLWAGARETLVIVNVSGAGPLAVTLDGRPVGVLPPVASEAEARAHHLRLTVFMGRHVLEARDAAGRVADRETIAVGWRTSYLYAPAHDPRACFEVTTAIYGTGFDPVPDRRLAPGPSAWSLPELPDVWFEDTPSWIRSKASGEKKMALRLVSCDRREEGGGRR